MALAHFQRAFTDQSGNVQSGLSVEVRRESDNALAALFSDPAGLTSKSNPFTTDGSGYGDFYVANGRYRIQASGIDWRNEDLITFENIDPGQFGAIGDGINDDTVALTNAINAAYAENLPLVMPGADYFITSTLPVYSGTIWRGAGMPFQKTSDVAATQVSVIGSSMIITLNDVGGDVTHRIMAGDPVKTTGFTDAGNNGLFSASSVDPANSTITLNNSSAVSTTTPGADASVEISVIAGGTIIRMQNLGDGSIHTGDRFVDCTGVRNLTWHDFGFIGPGINSIFGGGIRFRRTADNRAITGYHFKSILLEHVAMDGIRFDQLIHSYLGHLRISRCVGDGLLFKGASGIGGTTTSVHIDTPYIQNCKRGIASYISAYCTLTSPVIEGSSIGYYFERAIGNTLNAIGSETIKFDKSGQSNGVTGLFVDCYGLAINSPTIYYNTQESEWSKASFVFLDPKRRVESPLGVISGGHIHWSVGPKVDVLATRWEATTNIGRIFVDVSNDSGYVPPDDAGTPSSWIGNSYWDDSIQVKIGGVQRDSIFNERYKVTTIYKTPYVSGSDFEAARDPVSTDDSSAGFVAFSTSDGLWKNTTKPGEQGRFLCIDDTVGSARWVDANSLFEIEFEGRKENPLGKEAEPIASTAYAIRAGRNYGCDIATDNIQRVISTQSGGAGEFIAELDITHCFPERYLVRINYDPYTGNSTRQYVVKDHSKAVESTVDYVMVELIVGNDNGHVQEDIVKAATGIVLEFDELGVPYRLNPSLIKEDAASGNLFLYFAKDEFFSAGETIELFNSRLSAMEGTWTVDSARIINSSFIDNNVCVEITCTDKTLSLNIAKTVDDAVYVHTDQWSWPVSTQLSVNALDSLFIYDKANAVNQSEGKSGSVLFGAGVSQVSIDVAGANNYIFSGIFPGSFTQSKVLSSDFKTVTFERSDTTNEETMNWTGKRKKNPGFEAIYDRN